MVGRKWTYFGGCFGKEGGERGGTFVEGLGSVICEDAVGVMSWEVGDYDDALH